MKKKRARPLTTCGALSRREPVTASFVFRHHFQFTDYADNHDCLSHMRKYSASSHQPSFMNSQSSPPQYLYPRGMYTPIRRALTGTLRHALHINVAVLCSDVGAHKLVETPLQTHGSAEGWGGGALPVVLLRLADNRKLHSGDSSSQSFPQGPPHWESLWSAG